MLNLQTTLTHRYFALRQVQALALPSSRFQLSYHHLGESFVSLYGGSLVEGIE